MEIKFIREFRGARIYREDYDQVADIIDTYFIKDGKKYFLTGIAECASESEYLCLDMYLKQVEQNQGKYVTFHCADWCLVGKDRILDLLEFLQWVENNHYCFEPIKFLAMNLPGDPWDFQGGIDRIAVVFHFRIWDRDLAKKVHEKLIFLLEKQKSRDKENTGKKTEIKEKKMRNSTNQPIIESLRIKNANLKNESMS